MCLGVVLFGLILFGALSDSYTWISVSFFSWDVFSSYVFKYVSCPQRADLQETRSKPRGKGKKAEAMGNLKRFNVKSEFKTREEFMPLYMTVKRSEWTGIALMFQRKSTLG